MAPLPVSVVLPYHDGQAYLDEALASVRAQTAPPAEVVVVDDGSSAEGRAALEALGPGVRVVTLRKNLGPGPARNAGVEAAGQPFVAFLDVDDAWLPEKLEVQYAFMRAWPELDASHTEAVYRLADGSERTRPGRPRELTLDAALDDHVVSTPSLMIKRATFRALGGFDPAFRCTQDWDLQIRMAAAGCRVQLVDRVLVRVRREGHGHHSGDWRCYLAGHLRIVWKHRGLYRQRWGLRGWVGRAAFEVGRAGRRRGGLLGRCLALPARLGL